MQRIETHLRHEDDAVMSFKGSNVHQLMVGAKSSKEKQ